MKTLHPYNRTIFVVRGNAPTLLNRTKDFRPEALITIFADTHPCPQALTALSVSYRSDEVFGSFFKFESARSIINNNNHLLITNVENVGFSDYFYFYSR